MRVQAASNAVSLLRSAAGSAEVLRGLEIRLHAREPLEREKAPAPLHRLLDPAHRRVAPSLIWSHISSFEVLVFKYSDQCGIAAAKGSLCGGEAAIEASEAVATATAASRTSRAVRIAAPRIPRGVAAESPGESSDSHREVLGSLVRRPFGHPPQLDDLERADFGGSHRGELLERAGLPRLFRDAVAEVVARPGRDVELLAAEEETRVVVRSLLSSTASARSRAGRRPPWRGRSPAGSRPPARRRSGSASGSRRSRGPRAQSPTRRSPGHRRRPPRGTRGRARGRRAARAPRSAAR